MPLSDFQWIQLSSDYDSVTLNVWCNYRNIFGLILFRDIQSGLKNISVPLSNLLKYMLNLISINSSNMFTIPYASFQEWATKIEATSLLLQAMPFRKTMPSPILKIYIVPPLKKAILWWLLVKLLINNSLESQALQSWKIVPILCQKFLS